MVTAMAVVAYGLLLFGLKQASIEYEAQYHRFPHSMATYSRRVWLRREDSIEMAIFCNSLFWILLSPASLLSPSVLADTLTGSILFWVIRIWIWIGAALSIKPLVKALRYIFNERSALLKELAELDREGAADSPNTKA